MASTLSPSSVHLIISLVEDENRPTGPNYSLPSRPLPARYPHVLQHVNHKWRTIHELYRNIKPAPPLDYLGSPELTLVLKGQLDDADVHALFAHGKPLQFWGCPQLFVSKIVEAFNALQEEPTYLDVTISALSGLGATISSDAWPQIYTAHFPCHACTTVQTVKGRSIPRLQYP
ncbi:hypothetical protein AAVH_22955 [Aphelenchoides avenae]|nr:hypothetical protein AAVH_43585 [Aphelenchus avenae]KAH7709758.1 hypothetical protein AAVH_22955 [Aphelenchus avenae]